MAEDRKDSLTKLTEATKRVLTVELAAVKEGQAIKEEKKEQSTR